MNSILKRIAPALYAAAMMLAVVPTTGRAASSEGPSSVLATIGSHKITEREVDEKLKDQLTTLEAEVFEVREHAIDAIAADKLIQQAAENAHMSVDAYLKREVDDKVPNPPEGEVRRVYDAFKAQLPRPYEQEKPAIIGYLKEKEKVPLRRALIAKLRQEMGVKILMKPPRFDVPPGNHPSLGPKNAPVTIVEFGDFECPFTKKAEDTLKQVRAKYGNKIRLVYISHPLPIHSHAFLADGAGRCAAEQGKFWEYHDALFADQSKLKAEDLKATAARLKLDTKKFDECFDKRKHDADLQADQAEAEQLRVEGTPTFYINGRVLFGAESLADFQDLIDPELAAHHGKVARAD
jgi:predicted DsbA family dithiol-disulfide isomerase